MKWNFVCAGLRSAALASLLALPALGQQSEAPAADPHAGHQMPSPGASQDSTAMPMPDHSQMNHDAGHPMPTADATRDSTADHSQMNHGDMNAAGMLLMRMASGTSMNPQSWAMPMLMPKVGSWSMMIMGQDYLVDTQQSGPRGGDKFYSPNWFMVSGVHKLGGGSLLLQSMFSLDPATVTHESYPLLFQTGETAYGKPLVDAQHPHDFIMGLGASYAHALGENTMLQLYYAPVGDPALGPVAFAHRASAMELPQATLGHHWQDATHIAGNVATLALNHKWLRLEASGFFGTEPDENRWNIDWGPMNSYSGRVSVFPSKNWAAQFSAGRITKPERQADGDIVRITASLHYTRPMAAGTAWSTSLIWGRNHDTASQRNLNSYLIESVYPISKMDFLTGRIEWVDKDELFANDPVLEHKLERTAGSTFRVQAYTGGYTRDIGTFSHVEVGVGANLTAYAIPSAIQPFYGEHPFGVSVFMRFRLKAE